MGRAIVREPKVFLFDEPLSNLDAKLRGHMRVEIAMLHRRLGKTTVYVTHDQVEAMTLADRIVVMDQGRIQQMGSPDEIFNRPLNRFVAGFIGSPTMNFLNVMVRSDAGSLRFVGSSFSCDVPETLRNAAQRYKDQPLVLGVRPQSIQLGASEGSLELSLRVGVCEYLGTESVLSGFTAEESASVTLTAPGNLTGLIHRTIAVHVPLSSIYAFEPGEHGPSLNP